MQKRPLRKLPLKSKSRYTIEGQETVIFYSPHIYSWSAWIKFRMHTEVAGRTCKDYPMYGNVSRIDGDTNEVYVHRKHVLDRYNERRGLGLNNVDDILQEMSSSDANRIYTYLDDDFTSFVANSRNGLFLGFEDPDTEYKEIYTFITNEMMREGQNPEATDDLWQAVEDHKKRSGRDFSNELRDILKKIGLPLVAIVLSVFIC